jgi:DNA polymerase III epsilon subunit family exonuclease
MAWKDYFIAFDTETTGFGSNARILELAIVEVVNGEIVDEWSKLFNPPVNWSDPDVQRALDINHLTPAMLAGAPQFESVAGEVWSEFNKADIWVAHNIDFDVRMIRQELERASLKLPQAQVHACTQCIDFHTDKVSKGWKLGDLSNRYQVPQQLPAHRALADAKTAGLLFAKQLDRLPEEVAEMTKFAEQAMTSWRVGKGKKR